MIARLYAQMEGRYVLKIPLNCYHRYKFGLSLRDCLQAAQLVVMGIPGQVAQ